MYKFYPNGGNDLSEPADFSDNLLSRLWCKKLKEAFVTNYKLIAVVAFIFLSGCGVTPEKAKTEHEPVVLESSVKKETTPAPAEKATVIDPDVMYMLLVAEIAGQRQQYDVALDGYLEAARRVKDVRLAERAAKIALYIKDYDKEDEAVSLWLQEDPGNLTARKIALLSALRREDRTSAVNNAEYLLNKDPAGFEVTLLELVKALGPKANLTFVYDVLDQISEQNPKQAVVYFVQSMLAMQLNSKVLALQKIKEALQIDPDWKEALLFQAQITAYSGDLAEAEKLLRHLVKKYPDNVKIKRLLAQVLIKATKYKEAKEVYAEILKQNPDDDGARFSLALVYLQLQQDDKAESLLKKLLDAPGWQNQASFYLGRLAIKQGHLDEALVWFDKVSSGPLHFEASAAAVSLLIKERQFDEATSRLRFLRVRSKEQQLRALLLQVELFNAQQKYEKAFELLSAALEEMPKQKDLLYARALVAEKLDRLTVLESDLKKILADHPDDVSALNALGYTLADRTKRYDEAQTYLDKALSLQPDEAVIIDSYGWLQFKLNHLETALEYLQRAYSLQPESEIAAHLIDVLWALGRKKEAEKLFHRAIKAAPDDEYLLDARKRMQAGNKSD